MGDYLKSQFLIAEIQTLCLISVYFIPERLCQFNIVILNDIVGLL